MAAPPKIQAQGAHGWRHSFSPQFRNLRCDPPKRPSANTYMATEIRFSGKSGERSQIPRVLWHGIRAVSIDWGKTTTDGARGGFQNIFLSRRFTVTSST